MKQRAALPILVSLLLFGALLAFSLGSVPLSPAQLLGGLLGREGYETETAILLYVRLPRILAAILAGVALSHSGVLLQEVMSNALASPNTLGINAGAGFFAILHLVLFPTALAALPLAAFIGAFLTSLLTVALARAVGSERSTVLLAGIACTALFQAGISFFAVLDTDILSQYSAFSIGGFTGVTMSQLPIPALLTLLSLLFSFLLSRSLTVLSLGDAAASARGVRVHALRTIALLLASLSAASAISFAGLIGFVGLAVPHISRSLFGHRLGRNLLLAPLLGALLLLLADTAARTLFAPSDVPVGILTAFFGAPFFLLLLIGRRNRHA